MDSVLVDLDYLFNFTDTELHIDPNTIACTPWEAVIGASVHSTFALLVSVVSVFSNLLVILLVTHPHIHKTDVERSLMNLAGNDLLSTFCLVPWAANLHYGWTYGDFACKVLSVQKEQSFITGILILFDFFKRAVRSPNSRQSWSFPWILGALFALPEMLFNKVSELSNWTPVCHYHDGEPSLKLIWVFYSLFKCVIAVASSLLLLYVCVCSSGLANTKWWNKKAQKLVLMVTAAFALFRSPHYIAILVEILLNSGIVTATCSVFLATEKTVEITDILCWVHFCVGPFLYVILWDKLRRRLA